MVIKLLNISKFYQTLLCTFKQFKYMFFFLKRLIYKFCKIFDLKFFYFFKNFINVISHEI